MELSDHSDLPSLLARRQSGGALGSKACDCESWALLSVKGELLDEGPAVGSDCDAQDLRASGLDTPRLDPGELTINALHRAALDGNISRFRALVQAGVSVNAPLKQAQAEAATCGGRFVTLLHVLSSRMDIPSGLQALALVIKGKANLNARSSLGCTPLARACLCRHFAAAALLLQYKADTSPVDDEGRNALFCAVLPCPPVNGCRGSSPQAGHPTAFVHLLADANADMNTGGRVKPLHEAIMQSSRPVVTALLEKRALPDFLHVAVKVATKDIVADLLEHRANPFGKDDDGKSVLDLAFRRGNEEMISLLRDVIGDRERERLSTGCPHTAQTLQSSPRDSDMQDVEDDDGGLGLSGRQMGRADSGKARTSPRFSLSVAGAAILPVMPRRLSQKSSEETSKPVLANTFVPATVTDFFQRLPANCRKTTRNQHYQLVMLIALLTVLFFPDLWVVLQIHTNDGLDIIFMLVLFLFLVEILMQLIGVKAYVNSFFFWTDVVGALSVLLDHSAVGSLLPDSLENAAVVRTARIARLGARAGRFTKLIKLLRFLPGMQEDTRTKGTAKTMSGQLMASLSTRTTCLMILMVMVLPLFDMATYPENDFSLKVWANLLSHTCAQYNLSSCDAALVDFEAFYTDKEYYPFEVDWTVPAASLRPKRLQGERPRRKSDILEVESDSGYVVALFNFGSKNRVEALCNMSLLASVMVLMVVFSVLLSSAVSGIVLSPLEDLLEGVHYTASKIFTSVASMTAKCNTDDTMSESFSLDATEQANETELLERVIAKLAKLSAITMKPSPIDATTLENLNASDRAVLEGFQLDQLPLLPSRSTLFDREGRSISFAGSAGGDGGGDHGNQNSPSHAAELVLTLEKHLEEAGVAWSAVDSWELDVLSIGEKQRRMLCLCFLIFHAGPSYSSSQQQCLAAFTEAAAHGYNMPSKVPYHNWYHAVDVTHCLFRFLSLCATERFFSNRESFALVVSAICHDIGHPGWNNTFLAETSHELAIRYNDRSPLENMHCAKLFEIASQPRSAVFEVFDEAHYREMRQVCIEAILHTDNAHHFGMVKELQMFYEMNSDVFDMALNMYQSKEMDYPPIEICDLFVEGDKRRLMRNLALHFSDVSNPTKPFTICQEWAWRIIDEFFTQGDREKELGVPVQPLNDRDKVNRPYSQLGFIEFFAAPFAFAAVRLLPPLMCCTDQMMQNLSVWVKEWALGTQPVPDQDEVAKVHDRMAKLEAKYIFREGF